MKKYIAAIALIMSAGSAFASSQAHFGDAQSCTGTATNNHTGAVATFKAYSGEHAPNQFMIIDPVRHYSFMSPVMSRDPRTGGYIGTADGAVYRANYLPYKDMFDIISDGYTFSLVCVRK